MNTLLISIYIFTTLMSILQVDNFSELMTAKNYQNESVETFNVLFNGDSSNSVNKNQLLKELNDFSESMNFNIYLLDLGEIREDKLSLIAKTDDKSYMNSLPIKNAESVNTGIFTNLQNGDGNLFQVFPQVELRLQLVDTMPSNLNLDSYKIDLTIPISKDSKQIKSQLNLIANNYNAQVIEFEPHNNESSLQFINMNTFIYFSFVSIIILVAINALLSNSKEITIKKMEGYNPFRIWKSITIVEISVWPMLLILILQLFLTFYVLPYSSVAKFLMKIELIYFTISIAFTFVSTLLVIWIICGYKESELIKGRLPLKTIYYLVMMLKISIVLIIFTTVPSVVDDITKYISISSKSQDYISKYHGFHTIYGSSSDSKMLTDELSQNLYNRFNLEKFVYTAHENDNGQIVVSVNEDYLAREKILHSMNKIYFYAPSERIFLPSMLSDYFPDNVNEFEFIELENPLEDFTLKDKFVDIDSDDKLIIYIPTENSIYNSVFKYNGSESEFQQFINSMTSSENLGTPLSATSLVDNYVETEQLYAKTALKGIWVLVVTLSVLLLCNLSNVAITRRNFTSEDNIYKSEGYIFKRSTKENLTNNILMYLAITLLGILIFRINYISFVLPLILILTIDSLAMTGGKK